MTQKPERSPSFRHRAGRLPAFVSAQQRELKHFATELLAVRGLFPLLMKPRNGQQWSKEERDELLDQLRRLARLSPALVFLLLPGSTLLLPVYAWWLDRRRHGGERGGSVGETPPHASDEAKREASSILPPGKDPT